MRKSKVVFAITWAQLQALRDPDKQNRRSARQDPRDRLCDKGMLRCVQGDYERTSRGEQLLRALDALKVTP